MESRVSLIDRVKGKLQAGGNSELVEDPEQIVSYRVFTQAQFLRNVAIGATFGNELHEAQFAVGEEGRAFGVDHWRDPTVCHRLHEKMKLLAICPNLPLTDALHALRQHLKRVVPAQDAARTGTERLRDVRRFRRLQKEDDVCAFVQCVEFPGHPEAGSGSVFESAAHDERVGPLVMIRVQGFSGFDDRSDNRNGPAAAKGRLHQMTSHARVLRNQKGDWR